MFSETQVTTTHMLKNFIKVPKGIKSDIEKVEEEESSFSDEDTEEDKSPNRRARGVSADDNVFQRGVMNFEDYNYDSYN